MNLTSWEEKRLRYLITTEDEWIRISKADQEILAQILAESIFLHGCFKAKKLKIPRLDPIGG